MAQLWAADSEGRVFTLSPLENRWTMVQYRGIDIKRLSALEQSIWAIGGDHQIYLFIPSQDVPIRIQEVAYENQRWNPVEGFTSRLMPTDRHPWSNKTGLVARPKESIVLPTQNWRWEEEWYIQTTQKGQPLTLEGWMYAIDFPANYGPELRWNSMVRRRKWVRHRSYAAVDVWASVPGVHSDPVTEPFVDVSVGGLEIVGTDQEFYCVWAVTILGRVMFRENVTQDCPEGTNWSHIETPSGMEVHQISVGPSGLVWCICWDGSALIRLEVNRDNISGSKWAVVSAPGLENCRLLQVSVGWDVVWAISADGKVWFRKGIKGQYSSSNESYAVGNGWVEMVGEMMLISVGKHDQVYALGREDCTLYFRSGIQPLELSGKTWKAIRLGKHSRPKIKSEFDLLGSSGSRESSRRSSQSSLHWACASEGFHSTSSVFGAHPLTGGGEGNSILEQSGNFFSKDLQKSFDQHISVLEMKQSSLSPYPLSTRDKQRFRHHSASSSSSTASETILDFVSQDPDSLDRSHSTSLIKLTPATKIEQLMLPRPGQENNKQLQQRSLSDLDLSTDMPSYMEDWSGRSDSDSHGKNSMEKEDYDVGQHHPSEASWIWVSATAFHLDAGGPPNHWFSTFADGFNSVGALNTPWRQKIWAAFQKRSLKEVQKYKHQYPDAIEKSTWVKSGQCHIWNEHCIWEEGSMELQKQNRPFPNATNNDQEGHQTDTEWATLTFRCQKRKFVINLSEIICVLNLSNSFKPLLALHVKQKPLVQISYMSTADMEDWLGTLNAACSDISSFQFECLNSSLWSTTLNGEVYLVDGSQQDIDIATPTQLFWRLLGGGHLRKVESSPAQVVWGLGFNNTGWVYTGGFGGGPFAGLVGRNNLVHQMVDSKCMYIYENQRWNPLTGFSAHGLPTDRYMWSDRTGRHHCTKENTRLPSSHWQWSSDWEIDFKTPGGVDKEGWQFASDFPRSYHGYKGFTDYVRRRRWVRRCKLLSCGPWKPAGSTKLLDVSVQVDSHSPLNESYFSQANKAPSSLPIAIWAVAANGDALCRLGVTSDKPQGTHWVPVASEQSLVAISVGTGRCVWAITKDGTALYRHGIHPIACPTGQVWFHIEPPQAGCPLKHISVGATSVFALDDQDRLWFRQEIVAVFPEGTSWKLVSDHVRSISVGGKDQVWAVLDCVQTSKGELSGVVCKRKGITEEDKIGTSWETVIGGGWQSISCRGITPLL